MDAFTCDWTKASISTPVNSQPLWGTAARPSPAGEEAGLDPAADDCAVVDTEDALQVAQTVALHPSGLATALQSLDERTRGTVQAEALVELRGDLSRLV